VNRQRRAKQVRIFLLAEILARRKILLHLFQKWELIFVGCLQTGWVAEVVRRLLKMLDPMPMLQRQVILDS
jgi:hypothetical protein